MKALDMALKETENTGPASKDEFTIYDYIDSKQELGEDIGYRKAECDLKRMVREGKLYLRKGRVGQRQGNIYGLQHK